MQIRLVVGRLSVLAVALVIWYFLPWFGVSSFTIAPLPQVIEKLPAVLNPTSTLIPGGFYHHLSITLSEIAVALTICLVIGIGIGFAVGGSALLADIYEPLFYLFYSIPTVVLYFPILFIFKIGEPSKVAFGVLLGVFPLTVTTIAGLRAIKPAYLRVARALGATRLQTLFKVIIPAAAPTIMGGIRLSLISVIIGVLAGEVLGSAGGLGWAITTESFSMDPPAVYALIVIAIVLAYGMVQSISIVERKLFRHAT